MSHEMNRDDALFEELSKKKKRRRRRILITVLVILAVVGIALVITVTRLRATVRERFGGTGIEVLSREAVRGTLSTVVSGKGVLAEDDLESVTVPEGVTVEELLVEAGDTVTEGQVLATVDMPSVLTAMAALQTSLEDLDEQIADAAGDKVSASVTTAVAGRVKLIWAEKDMSVVDCMAEHGALAVLSLDGFMAVDIPAGDLAKGDAVTVTLPEGKELKGTVDAVLGGMATVLVTDDGPKYDEEVTVSLNGETLGTGRLYIHEPLAITGYAGTVQSVQVTENRKVYKNASLFRLTDTGTTHTYDVLLRTRSEQEETLLELLELRRSGAVLAPFDGSVYTLDHDETLAPTALVTLSPDENMTVTLSVDESDILSLELGQTAEITVSSLSEEPFEGTVTEVQRSTSTSGTYTAVVTLPKSEGMLSGMTASVSIRITGVEDALLIPIEALHQTRDRAYVYTTYDAETETFGGEVEVTVGIMGSTQVEILSGLSEGDTVWYTEEMTIFDFFGGMGGMSGMGGNSGGGMPSGNMPSGGMPSGDFGGDRGGLPSGDFGGQRPGGRD